MVLSNIWSKQKSNTNSTVVYCMFSKFYADLFQIFAWTCNLELQLVFLFVLERGRRQELSGSQTDRTVQGHSKQCFSKASSQKISWILLVVALLWQCILPWTGKTTKLWRYWDIVHIQWTSLNGITLGQT